MFLAKSEPLANIEHPKIKLPGSNVSIEGII